MNNRYERDYWQRDDERQGRRDGNDDRRHEDQRRNQGSRDDNRHFGSRDDHDRWPNRVEGRDRSRWDERDERYSQGERGYEADRHSGQQHYGQQYGTFGSERQQTQGHDYRAGGAYRSGGPEHRYGSQHDYSGPDYRNQNQDRPDYRFSHGSGQEYRQYNAENRWGNENRSQQQLPYAGSGEPRWGESSRGAYQGAGEFSDYVRNWDRPQHSSQYGQSQYGQSQYGQYGGSDSNRYGRGNAGSYGGYGTYGGAGSYGTYGSSYGQGSDWNRDQNRNRQEGGFFGRGPKGYTRSDDRIREDVCDRLSFDDEVDASDITVTVSNGEVTLEGTVPDRRSKHRAEDISDNVNGVRDVHNRLKARRGFFQEVGDRLMGREEEQEQGHAGSGTKNSPSAGTKSSTSTSSSGTYGTSSTTATTGATGTTVPNGRS